MPGSSLVHRFRRTWRTQHLSRAVFPNGEGLIHPDEPRSIIVEAFSNLVSKLWKLLWVVYAKPTFSKGKYVLEYLGRYTHRVGIANSRLLDVTNEYVIFRTKGDGTENLTPADFLWRFVQHVLPDGFHEIRHYGLNASPEEREIARTILKMQVVVVKPLSWRERLENITDHEVGRCPQCACTLIQLPLAMARAAQGWTDFVTFCQTRA